MAAENEKEFKPKKSGEMSSAYRDRIAREYAEGYPTTETLAEFLAAHKSGGKDAIKALLEKRRAVLLEAKKSTSDE